jgi:hypothetical protein
VDCSQRYSSDQLTRELDEFVGCVRQRTTPRVHGQAALDALELAGQVLDGIRSHTWANANDGQRGSRGWLLPPTQEAA